MWNYTLTVLCIVSFFITSSVQAEARRDGEFKRFNVGRIINGTVAFPGQFPQQVSLRYKYTENHFCGGSVLTPDWIITAAHCVLAHNSVLIKDPYSIVIVAGDILLRSLKESHQWSAISKHIIHPNYDKNTLQNDIALVKLETKLVLDPYVHPLPVMRDIPIPGTMCQVSGWGHQREGGRVTEHLLKVSVPIISTDQCKNLVGNIPHGVICAGFLEGGKDSCQGDSGGGLICNKLLTGIVSSGTGCARPRSPGLYTDITEYVLWIEIYVNLTEKHFIRSTPYVRGASSQLQSDFFNTHLGVILFVISHLIKYLC